MPTKTSLTPFVARLDAWFAKEQRAMPWRSKPSPYNVWISEMMLQQTQVATVIPYFQRFMTAFPTIQALAAADLQDVLKVWEGLGYYSRARNIQKAAKVLVSDYDSKLPETYEGLQELPGIGPYIAAAIASIAFGKAVPVVDGNVLRVMTRYWGLWDDITQGKTRTLIFDSLGPHVPLDRPGDFNQALMELGALICRPQSPSCETCPLQSSCVAHRDSLQSDLPVKKKKAPVPTHQIGVALIVHEGKVWIQQRKETQMLGGLWEFPGGKQEKGEDIEATVSREVKEETGFDVQGLEHLATVDHAYSHFKIQMHAYICRLVSGSTVDGQHWNGRWVSKADLADYAFPKANKVVIDAFITQE